jgi:hypothetical protein
VGILIKLLGFERARISSAKTPMVPIFLWNRIAPFDHSG